MKWQADARIMWQEVSRQILAVPSDNSLRLIVLAAHPDDEIIGASELLARFPDSLVVYLTDGAPRDSRFWTGGPYDSREHYANTRRAEAIRALSYADIPKENLCWLGATDQESSFEMSFFVAAFASLLERMQPDAIVTHSYEGGHPDHDTAAAIAQMTASQDRFANCAVVEMTSYHARDGRCVTGEFLNSPQLGKQRLDTTTSEIAFDLSESARERKRAMLGAHVSQECVLEGFSVDRERLRLSPGYDFSQPPHEGRLWYESLGWPMTGALWRELARTANLQERSCA